MKKQNIEFVKQTLKDLDTDYLDNEDNQQIVENT